jgi:hypothetical protein
MIAIDPGLSTGWAWFSPGRELEGCGGFNPEKEPCPVSSASGINQIVIELPCDRPGMRKGSVNDLITLALRAGIVAGQLLGPRPIWWIRPDEWKGQISKDLCRERIRMLLLASELARIPHGAPHDVWDAIGLGLFALGRARRGMISLEA